MEKNIQKSLEKFIQKELSVDEKIALEKKKHLKQSNGLIERLDKIFISENGKQLLREQY